MTESRDADVWSLQQHIATLRRGLLAATVDAAHPERGLQRISFHSARPDWKLLCVTASDAHKWPATIADHYVRGNDLVAAYEANDVWPYAPQVYWSADSTQRSPDIFASLRLLVSIQTHLLDTHPLVEISSRIPAEETLLIVQREDGEVGVETLTTHARKIESAAGNCCLLRRLPSNEASYAEFMPASDFRFLNAARAADGHSQSRWELFAEFLEKGVIRKAQLQMALLDRAKDVELATSMCRQLTSRELPLTT